MDQTTLAVALISISSDLHAGANASWITSAYFLTSTSFQLLYGRLSDICACEAGWCGIHSPTFPLQWAASNAFSQA